MASPSDVRDWIALLEREGELVRVGAEVDPDLEITENGDGARGRLVDALGVLRICEFG